MTHRECWACGNTVIYYRDVLDMLWCEPCWTAAETEATTLREASE